MTSDQLTELQVEIFCFYPDMKQPERASSDLRGSLPSRAVQHCPPVTAASGFGWYVYPPVDFALRWDGQHTEWSLLEGNEPAGWQSLAGGHDAMLPGVKQMIAELPERFHPGSDVFDRFEGGFPFLDADPRAQHLIELSTGLVARTSPGWCLLARGVPNWPLDRGLQVLDGLVETDWYRATIPTIVRLTEPHRIVRIYRNQPLVALQPVHRGTYAAMAHYSVTPVTPVTGVASWPQDVWEEYVDMRRKRQDRTKRSAYRREQRRLMRDSTGYQPLGAAGATPEAAGAPGVGRPAGASAGSPAVSPAVSSAVSPADRPPDPPPDPPADPLSTPA